MKVIAIQNWRSRSRGRTSRLECLPRGTSAMCRRPSTLCTPASYRPRGIRRQSDEWLLAASGDLSNSRALSEFHRRCEALIAARPPQASLDLTKVERADTKLVAVLLLVVRLARSAHVVLDIRVSSRLRQWIAVCKADQLLRPNVVIQTRA